MEKAAKMVLAPGYQPAEKSDPGNENSNFHALQQSHVSLPH